MNMPIHILIRIPIHPSIYYVVLMHIPMPAPIYTSIHIFMHTSIHTSTHMSYTRLSKDMPMPMSTHMPIYR